MFGNWDGFTCQDIGGKLTCRETNDLAAAMVALGNRDLAKMLISAHGSEDEDPAETGGETMDEHYAYRGEAEASEYVNREFGPTYEEWDEAVRENMARTERNVFGDED